jgi:tetraprenyl-beta-curcumene synthase
VTNPKTRRTGIDTAFLSAAVCYWTSVFPCTNREIRRWERHARSIPDASLKALALKALREERGNLEGATAFAAFAPRKHRMAIVCAATAFQAAYDYADAISEQTAGVPGNTRQLHKSLLIALSPDSSHLDYYAYHDHRDDGGYLNRLVDRCRTALCRLPCLPAVSHHMRHAASRIVTYQELNHAGPTGSFHTFARWASDQTPRGTDLRWWETGAAAGSSLTVFALMSAAAKPVLATGYPQALERAYFPWIGSLHTLLDSLIDEHEDHLAGQHSFTRLYVSAEQTASRLELLAKQAALHADGLPDGNQHMMIFAAMVSFYLTAPQARAPHAYLATERVLNTLNGHTAPSMLMLRIRRALKDLARRSERGR